MLFYKPCTNSKFYKMPLDVYLLISYKKPCENYVSSCSDSFAPYITTYEIIIYHKHKSQRTKVIDMKLLYTFVMVAIAATRDRTGDPG